MGGGATHQTQSDRVSHPPRFGEASGVGSHTPSLSAPLADIQNSGQANLPPSDAKPERGGVDATGAFPNFLNSRGAAPNHLTAIEGRGSRAATNGCGDPQTLSPRQREVLNTIRAYHAMHSRMPTVKELKHALNTRSACYIGFAMQRLVDVGELKRQPRYVLREEARQ